MHIVFRIGPRQRVHDEKLILPFDVSYDDFLLLLQQAQKQIVNVLFSSDVYLYMQRGCSKVVSSFTFRDLVESRY